MMAGRRWSEGLHQALEAKEGVEIQRENQTLASITFQNYFRHVSQAGRHDRHGHDRGPEFGEIYELEVVEIPTNVPVIRARTPTTRSTAPPKTRSVRHRQGDPGRAPAPAADAGRHGVDREVGDVGGAEEGEIPHNVLNAATTSRRPRSSPRPAARAPSPSPPTWPAAAPTSSSAATPTMLRAEAEIAADDPKGGRTRRDRDPRPRSPRQPRVVRKAGGLFVIGTERHESRRIDNQLRGRSGRQGDPAPRGSSCRSKTT